MNTFYLKADTEAAMLSALKAAGYETSDGRLMRSSHQHSTILRGTLYEPTGNMRTGEDGIEYPEMQAVPGYHADFYAESLPAALEPYQIEPATPQFRRAGEA